MFRAALYEAKRLLDVLEITSTLLEEAEFKIAKEGLQLRAMDGSRTAMIDLDLPRSFFDQYQCDQTSELRFNIETVLRMLDGVRAKEPMEIEYYEDQARLVIRIPGDYQRVVSLNTLAVERDFERQPRVAFDVSAEIQAEVLGRVIADAQKVGKEVSIEAKENAMSISAVGLIGSFKSTIRLGDPSLISLSISQESNATYGLGLLGNVVKNASQICSNLTVEISSEKVLRLGFLMPEGRLHFYFAPLMEEE